MQNPISIRVSDRIQLLMETNKPVIALNLMGLSLLSAKWFDREQCVFWIDGVAGTIFGKINGLSARRIPGRELFMMALKYIKRDMSDRPVVILGMDHEVGKVQSILERQVECRGLPWIQTSTEAEHLDFGNLTPNHIVFLAIGSPKQEWISKVIFSKTGAKCLCVGGAINMIEGYERVAPAFLQKIGLEWAFRLRQDPSRRLVRLFQTLPKGLLNLRLAGYAEELHD